MIVQQYFCRLWSYLPASGSSEGFQWSQNVVCGGHHQGSYQVQKEETGPNARWLENQLEVSPHQSSTQSNNGWRNELTWWTEKETTFYLSTRLLTLNGMVAQRSWNASLTCCEKRLGTRLDVLNAVADSWTDRWVLRVAGTKHGKGGLCGKEGLCVKRRGLSP